MTDRDAVRQWMDRYLRAWTTNEADDVAVLFTEDARYFTLPTREPVVGRAAIVAMWLQRADKPGGWTARLDVIAVDGDTAVVDGEVDYVGSPDFRNLWVIKFGADGRAVEFTEWWLNR